MPMTVRDILASADAFRAAYPSWPHAEPEEPASLEDRIAAWITSNHVTGHYDTGGITSRLVAGIHPDTLEGWLAVRPDLLRHACEHVKDEADMTVTEWLTEDHLHGHGRKPCRQRREGA